MGFAGEVGRGFRFAALLNRRVGVKFRPNLFKSIRYGTPKVASRKLSKVASIYVLFQTL